MIVNLKCAKKREENKRTCFISHQVDDCARLFPFLLLPSGSHHGSQHPTIPLGERKPRVWNIQNIQSYNATYAMLHNTTYTRPSTPYNADTRNKMWTRAKLLRLYTCRCGLLMQQAANLRSKCACNSGYHENKQADTYCCCERVSEIRLGSSKVAVNYYCMSI